MEGRKLRRFVGDSIWTIAGLILMNAAAQFGVYPIWNRQMGNEAYGKVLYLIAGMNILAISMGAACNYGRMRASAEGPTGNRTYNRMLGIASCAAIPYMGLVYLLSGNADRPAAEIPLVMLLCVATMWRYYADVGYRLQLNYKGCFVYYGVIALGYAAGIGLFLWLGLWPLALLPGELAGLALVYFRGDTLRNEPAAGGDDRWIVKIVLTLLGTEVISNLIANGDRVMLNWVLGGTAVTLYYQASLVGKTMSLITTPLNSVLIGYLARSKQRFTRGLMLRVTGLSLAALAVGTAGCVLGSHILIRLLYPQNYELVKGYFWLANLGQAAFFTSGVAATVLLRYCRVRYQLVINVVYAVLFVGLGLPAVYKGGLEYFCAAVALAGLGKLACVLILGFRDAEKDNRGDSGETE